MAHHRHKSLNPFRHEHVPPTLLPNVKTYKYSGHDKSILSNLVMNYYWSAVVELVPMWVAPNLITLIGFIISVSSTLLILFFHDVDSFFFGGDLSVGLVPGELPSFVWYYAAFALFAYQTLDAIDGKQARRTRSGSPMGELFDHGCDAFFTPLLQVNICAALGLDSTSHFYFFLLVTLGLLFAIWEQYVTGTLDFGYITGPTEGILLTCGIFTITGMYGSAFWKNSKFPYPFEISGFPLATWGDFVLCFTVVAAVLTVVTNISHVVSRPSVHKAPLVSLTSLVPHVVLVWCVFEFRDEFPDVVASNKYLLELCHGFLASYTATRLTVARLCSMPYRPLSVFYVLSLVVFGGSVLLHRAEQSHALVQADAVGWMLRGLVTIGIAQYLHLIVSVFRQISHILNIKIFKIKQSN